MPNAPDNQTVAVPPRYGIGSQITIFVLALLTACTVLIASQLPDDASKLSEQPVIARLCKHIDCSFLTAENAWANPAYLEINDVLIYESGQDNRFTLRLAISNTDAYAQTLPVLTLRLLDNGERTIEERTIKLAQYSQVKKIAANKTEQFNLPLSGIAKAAAKYTVAITYED